MRFIELAFHLGVVFAIFGFIWGFFQVLVTLLRGSTGKSIIEEYSLKFVQYFFLVDITFLFCVKKESNDQLLLSELIFSAFILILYFLGKLQNNQRRMNIFQISAARFPNINPIFNLKLEISAIIFGIGVFCFFIFYPVFAQNPVSSWFYNSILGIESTPIFGFIFKVIGFFVLLRILLKIINGFVFLVSGKPIISVQSEFNSHSDNQKFDDFEEMN